MAELTNQSTTEFKSDSPLTRCAEIFFSAVAFGPLWFALVIIGGVIFSSGCRNCGQQPCAPQPYTPYNANAPYGYGYNANPASSAGGGGLAQARIPAPPTYSLNIPGGRNYNTANANGYRVGQLPSGLLNTQQNAPTPANRPANYNQQQGWRQSDGNNLNTSSTGQTGGTGGTGGIGGSNRVADATSVLESSAGVNSPGGGWATRTASSSNSVGNGVSFTQSNDYRTTSTDERRDNSRLPVTDATNVRATVPFVQNQTGGSGQYVRPYYVPQRQNQPRYAAATPTTYYQGAFEQPNVRNYNNSTQPQNYQGSFAQRYAAAQPQGQVLAQSTTRYDPYQSSASTASNDWRERGRESQSY